MNSSSQKTGFDRLTIYLHWLIALFFLGLIASVFIANDVLPKDDPSKATLMMIHKSLGVLIIPLVVLRVIWRLVSPPPALLPAAGWTMAIATIVHLALYAIMLIQPFSGLFMALFKGYSVSVFGLFTIEAPAEKLPELGSILHSTHEITGTLIYILVSLHIAGALYHHFILRDDVLKRMRGRA